jgi:hypothetical protein
MKEGELLRILHEKGCILLKHCKKHDKYFQPGTGKTEQVPRHPKINERLAQKIIRNLS